MKLLTAFDALAYIRDPDGTHCILTGCRTDAATDRLHYRHKIPLSPTQRDAIGEVIDGATFAQRRIIAGLAAVLEPPEAEHRTAGELCATAPDDLCARCGERPARDGDALCADCREELGEPLRERPTYQPYSNTVCPICGHALRPAVHCTLAGACVCMTHCFSPPCEYLDTSTSLVRCTYLEHRGGAEIHNKKTV